MDGQTEPLDLCAVGGGGTIKTGSGQLSTGETG